MLFQISSHASVDNSIQFFSGKYFPTPARIINNGSDSATGAIHQNGHHTNILNSRSDNRLIVNTFDVTTILFYTVVCHHNLSNKCNDDLFLKTEKEDELRSSDIHNDPRAIRSANIGNQRA